MRLFSVFMCLIEAHEGNVAAVLAVTAGKCSVARMKAEFDEVRIGCVNKTFKMTSETHLSARMGNDRCQLRFGRAIERCYEGSDDAAARVGRLPIVTKVKQLLNRRISTLTAAGWR
ncbi:hypothetical protein Tcan_12168 [Toxocara canis]|uniref:Uncharacterized protein n=1 Tax=Toxocara canis TaxID=6265 RepID=A0A0B2USA7_TOXCA|nr:hypothetical protein Tcan_12168 [Toxocara canis]